MGIPTRLVVGSVASAATPRRAASLAASWLVCFQCRQRLLMRRQLFSSSSPVPAGFQPYTFPTNNKHIPAAAAAGAGADKHTTTSVEMPLLPWPLQNPRPSRRGAQDFGAHHHQNISPRETVKGEGDAEGDIEGGWRARQSRAREEAGVSASSSVTVGAGDSTTAIPAARHSASSREATATPQPSSPSPLSSSAEDPTTAAPSPTITATTTTTATTATTSSPTATTATAADMTTPPPQQTRPRSRLRAPRKAAMRLTPAAVEQLRRLMSGPEPKTIKVGVRNRGCSGLAYHLTYVDGGVAGPFDEVLEQDGVRVLIDSKALFSIIGSEMDWVEDRLSQRFVFRNPNIKEQCGCGESFSV